MCVFVNYDHFIARRKVWTETDLWVMPVCACRKPVNRLVSTAIIISSSLVSPCSCMSIFYPDGTINLTNSAILRLETIPMIPCLIAMMMPFTSLLDSRPGAAPKVDTQRPPGDLWVWRPGDIRPGRLTWNLRIHPWKRKIIFQTINFRFYVNLPGCIWMVWWWYMMMMMRRRTGFFEGQK